MIVKIINKNNNDFEKEFKVRRMNYDQTVVNYPNTKGINVFDNNDLEFIVESEIDEFLIKYKDFLKIKLNRGISITFYKAILGSIENQIESEVVSLNLLKDKYKINNRGIWDKEIVCVVNGYYPLSIVASGQNFKKTGYNINIEEIKAEEFDEFCTFEIKKIQKEIKEREAQLSRFGLALNQVKSRGEEVMLLRS